MKFKKKPVKGRKGAMELSMNMLVVLILSVAILSLGVWFINKVVTKGSDMRDRTIDSVDENLADIMCDSSASVCLQPASVDMGITDAQKFTVKIINIDDEQDFRIRVNLTGAYAADESGTPISAVDKNYVSNNWPIYDPTPFNISANGEKQKGIAVDVKAKMASSEDTVPGIYNFAVKIQRQDETDPTIWHQYGRTQLLMINVK